MSEVATLLTRLRTLRDRPWVSGEGRARFDRLMPRLLTVLSESGRAAIALPRIVPLLESVMRRSAYFALLLENPQALDLLVWMCAESRITSYNVCYTKLLRTAGEQVIDAVDHTQRARTDQIPGQHVDARVV